MTVVATGAEMVRRLGVVELRLKRVSEEPRDGFCQFVARCLLFPVFHLRETLLYLVFNAQQRAIFRLQVECLRLEGKECTLQVEDYLVPVFPRLRVPQSLQKLYRRLNA